MGFAVLTDTQPFWEIRLIVDHASADAFEAALEAFAISVARFEEAPGPGGTVHEPPATWRLQATCDAAPDMAALSLKLSLAAERAGVGVPDFTVEKLPDVDWLALNRSQFPPIEAGRFFIHGVHFDGPFPEDRIVIRLDAGPAFGSGTHETTQGCLLALQEIIEGDSASTGGSVRRPLDLGCGSGILAIAMAKLAGLPVTASDIDPMAAATTAANARDNGVADLVTAFVEDGIGPRLRAKAPFDLVCANILAEPLCRMAGDIAEITSDDGALVLSGLLTRQAEEVKAAYAAQGFGCARAIARGDWATLVLKRM